MFLSVRAVRKHRLPLFYGIESNVTEFSKFKIRLKGKRIKCVFLRENGFMNRQLKLLVFRNIAQQ